jgi:hypothetical protein
MTVRILRESFHDLLIAAALALLLAAAPAEGQVTQSAPLVGERIATMTWVDNSDNEDGFEILMRKGDGTYEVRGKVPANVTIFQPIVVGAEGSGWCFAVRAFSAAGVSPRSEDTCAWIPLNTPTELAASALGGLVTLHWRDNSAAELGYRIYRDNVEIAAVGANVTTFSETLMSPPGTRHAYEVAAYVKNINVPSARSNQAQVEVVIVIAPPTLPAVRF